MSSVADMLGDACSNLFPNVKHEHFSSDLPNGANPLDQLPVRDLTKFGANSGHGRFHPAEGGTSSGGTHRRKHGPHSVNPMPPPKAPPGPNQTAGRKAYGSNRYGKAPIPVQRYDSGADVGLLKECAHYATFGSHFEHDRGILKAGERQANLGRTTLGPTTATRRTSPRKRIHNLSRTGQIAKQVVFAAEVEEKAVDFLACARYVFFLLYCTLMLCHIVKDKREKRKEKSRRSC
jgi:hypothetical protein